MPTLSTCCAGARVSIDVHAPGRGPIVIETVGPGDVVGWSWLVPPYRWTFDARAKDRGGRHRDRRRVPSRQGVESTRPSGFELLSRVSVELLARLQATRMRLLDLYGDHRDADVDRAPERPIMSRGDRAP